MSKTLVCTNVLENVKSLPFGSHCQEWFRLGRNTNDDFIFFHPERFSIDNARTQAANYAMELECDYIYFIDDDMILSPNTYKSLKACDADVAMAHTYIRGYPFDVMFFKIEEQKKNIRNFSGMDRRLIHYNDWENHIDESGLVECHAVGFACALLKVKNLLEIPPPFFVTGPQQTEDVYYCMKLKYHKPESRIVVDTKVPTGHLLSPEVITISTRKKLMEYYKPEIEENKSGDRGEEYKKLNLENNTQWEDANV